MFYQVLFALGLTCVTVILHAIGSVWIVMPATGMWKRVATATATNRPVWALARLIGLLLILHLVEMTVWGAGYAMGGVLPDFETSLYFSMTSYTTLGYGDVLLPAAWRLLGPMEAIVGVLMLGWSTSIIVAAVHRMYNDRLPVES